MSNWISLGRKFLACSWRDQWLLIRVFGLSGLIRGLLLLLPFRLIAPGLGRHMKESSFDTPEGTARIKKISWAIGSVSRFTPWESKCLVQAIVAKILLRRGRFPNTLYLGVGKDEAGKMVAHAWIRVGNQAVTGGRNNQKYAVVGSFTDE